jgi:hypothetical protein
MEFAEKLFDALKNSRGVEELGGTLKISADIEVEIYINSGTNLTPIPKVLEVRSERGMWIIRDHKGDTSYFAAERIAGLKVNDSEKRKKEGERGGAGFKQGM